MVEMEGGCLDSCWLRGGAFVEVLLVQGAAADRESAAANIEGSATNKEGVDANRAGASTNRYGGAADREGAASNREGAAPDREREIMLQTMLYLLGNNGVLVGDRIIRAR